MRKLKGTLRETWRNAVVSARGRVEEVHKVVFLFDPSKISRKEFIAAMYCYLEMSPPKCFSINYKP